MAPLSYASTGSAPDLRPSGAALAAYRALEAKGSYVVPRTLRFGGRCDGSGHDPELQIPQ